MSAVLGREDDPLPANLFQYAAVLAATGPMQALRDPVLGDSAALTLDRLEASLPDAGRRARKAFHYVPLGPKDYSGHEATLDVLVRAILRRQSVRMQYRDDDGLVRLVEPRTVVLYRDALYLTARQVEPAAADRTYAVDRIRQVQLLRDRPFTVPASYDPADSFSQTFGMWSGHGAPEHVVLRFHGRAASLVAERTWPGQRSMEHTNDSLELVLDVAITPELRAWLMSWGAKVEVVQPVDLRADVAAELMLAAAQYQ